MRHKIISRIRTAILLLVSAELAICAVQPPSKEDAQKELYAARWEHAAELYRQILDADPAWGAGWDALVQALLEAHKTPEAYAAADAALVKAPNTAGAQTAAGRVLYRKGQLPKAEAAFRAARKLDPNYAGALEGLARIYAIIAKYKTASELMLQAYHAEPNDPDLMLAHANSLEGKEHIAALEQVLLIYDPGSREARALRAHIAGDKAVQDRKTRVMTTPYQPYEFKLMDLVSGPNRSPGTALRVTFNGRYTGTLLLDTGASGISLSPKAAKKAGLEELEEGGRESYGLGDEKPRDAFSYLAAEVSAGDMAWSNYPVHIIDTAKDSDRDGIIGGDVFSRFLVELDFPRMTMGLTPYPPEATHESGPRDAGDPPEGFHRIYRLGHTLLMPVLINGGPSRLFILDSGASTNLIDTEAAEEETKIHGDSFVTIRGLQGRVEKVSRADHVTLTFAGMRQENPGLFAVNLHTISDRVGIEESGILGMPVLRQLRMVIDYRDAAVLLQYKR